LVEADVNGQFFPNEKLTEGKALEELDGFIDDVFWTELAGRLAARDLRAELGAKKLDEELNEADETRLDEIEDKYWREFETHGVEHLVLLRGGQG
jgi:hypothetical protein